MCAAYGWERVLRTDDPLRGGKLAAFVLHMTTKTTLVYGSIENYVWGPRLGKTQNIRQRTHDF